MDRRDLRLHARLLYGAAAAVMLAGAARAEEATRFDIPPQSLATALAAFGVQSRHPVIATPDLTETKMTRGLVDSVESDAALRRMLSGTGLTYRRTGDAYLIVRAAEARLTPQRIATIDAAATADAGPGETVASESNVVQELVVTAQKREEAIQTVPIAISAFTQKTLDAQKIETGGDLLKAIPNVTFSKNNFSGYNFSIRGIGTKAVSVTTDPGVAVSFNNTTLIRNRLFEQEYFDVERVEVLRGPQGTLYGRNATSGVINVISAKPDLSGFSGMVKAEVGNYASRRAVGMLNIPVVEGKLAVRIAGSYTLRNGYNIDLYNNQPQDGRNLWSGRVTVGFRPFERLRGNLIWEHFDENDDRARTGKQLCTHDAGPTKIGDFNIPVDDTLTRGFFSQGCLPASLYDKNAFGTPNGLAIPFIYALEISALNCGHFGCSPITRGVDPYGDTTQSTDLRALYSQIEPTYRAKADVYELNFDFDLTPGLTLSSQTAYDKDQLYSSQDFNRYTTVPTFIDTTTFPPDRPSYGLIPGGIFCDPQLGCSKTIVGEDISRAKSRQFSQEFRLQSNFAGRLNFSAGVDFTRYKTVEDYYVFFNGITLAIPTIINAQSFIGGRDFSKFTTNPDCSSLRDYGGGLTGPDGIICVPIEQNPINAIQDTGHNYFLSRNPYRLNSKAAFGEVYWQATDTVKVTLGLRYTDDRKTFTPIPSETVLSDASRLDQFGPDLLPPDLVARLKGLPLVSFGAGAYPALPDIVQGWREVTGRFGADWRPTLPWTDQTMVYAFYSRGYKGGGMNPPRIGLNYAALQANGVILAPSAPPNFRPEFVNAFELGTKNTLLGGSLVVNGDAFFYDYTDYQVSKIVDRTANNENFDARIWGLEFESVWQPVRNLRLNVALGYLNTELGKGSKSIDIMDRTAGNTDWVLLKPNIALTSNCIAPVAVVQQFLDVGQQAVLNNLCPGGNLTGQTFSGRPDIFGNIQELPGGGFYDPAQYPQANFGAGFDKDVSGHELPNSPHYTVSLGGQYSMDLFQSWRATLRGDFYWQSQSWARVYEDPIDKLHAWKNGNVRLTFEKPDDGLEIELYVKNVFNDTPITDTFLNSDDTALTTNVFVLDPRIVGFSIKKTF